MQWILQQFEDTEKLAEALDRLGIVYSWHKVVPFVGDLKPEPVIENPDAVVMFGAYSLWRYAERHGYRPGVFKLRPFLHEVVWQRFMLNGTDALLLTPADVPARLAGQTRDWFVRPVDDSKELAGNVMTSADIVAMCETLLVLSEDEIPAGSLRHDTLLMLSEPVKVLREWRLWVVDQRVVTWSLYREAGRVVYREEIDDDVLAFAQRMVDINPGYAPAYVLDVCRTADGLKLLETNCINAAGFYAADLFRLAASLDSMES